MMAGIGESIAVAMLESLVLKLGKMLVEGAASLRGVGDEIQSMTDELTPMVDFLRIAQQRPESVNEAKSWLKQVRRLVYDIEDCIEEYTLRLGQFDDKDLQTGCLRRATRRIRKLRVCRRVYTKIKTLKTRVEDVRRRGSWYFLIGAAPGTSSVSSARPLYDPRLAAPFVEDTEVVGIDDRRDELLGWLLAEDEPQLRVISVVGMGGLGKTTLVRKVYESPRISDGCFSNRAWITVSQCPDVKGLLKNMIGQLISPPPEEIETADETRLIEILRSHLQNQRYVVVLDDVWTVIHLETFKSALPSNTLVSRIMVTTRIQEVADTCCANGHGRVYQIQPLTHQKSSDLFCKRVFDEYICPPHLKDISEGILKKCGGLPLAIVTIGGLLAVKPNKTREVWQNLLHRLRHELESNPRLDRMTQILNLSFDDLPYHLKPCFLYLSIFPEDYSIGRKRLVRLWVAQGFVSRTPPDGTPEEVAEGYFSELINRSLLQSSELGINGRVRSCRVHDVVREVMMSKSEEEMSISVPGGEGYTRHLSVLGKSSSLGETRLAHIRSLTLFGDGTISSISPSMKLLRVLDLQGCRYMEGGHLETICKFILLKYLNLRGTGVQNLPESLGKLGNLETLDIRDTSSKLPTTVIKLQKLRHLLYSTYAGISFSAHGRFPSTTGMGLPVGVGNLKSLLTLSYVGAYLCSEGTIRALGELTQLRKLSIVLRTQESGMELCAALEKLSGCLRSLTVWTPPELKGFSFLDSLSSPPLHLTSLKLGGHLEVLPCWVANLSNVTEIALYGSVIREDALQVLQALPSLMELRLYSSDGMYMCFRGDGFPSLKFLCLNAYDGLQSVRFEPGVMPILEKLRLRRCKLGESPLGMEYLVRLKEIVVVDGIDGEHWTVLEKAAGAHPNHPRLTTVDTTGVISHKIKF